MRKRREKIPCMFFILLILIGMATVYISPVSSPTEAKLYVNPPSIIDQTLTPPKNFTVDVILANVTNLYLWEYKLGWDPTILKLVKRVTHVPSGFEPPGGYLVKDAVGADYHWYAYTALAPTEPFNGTISLCTYTFQVLDIGKCALHIYEDTLADNKVNDIPHTVQDGYFDNRPPPLPALIYVDPPRIVNLTLVPCQNFAVNVSIIDASYLYSFEFKLSFDPDLLNATGAVLGNIFPPVTPTIEINNTAGYVRFSASFEPPEPEVSGNGTLAVITFHVEGLGACKLTLSDTALADSEGQPLPHSTTDGYFNNVLLAKLAVEPPEIFDPTLMPPQTFEINVTLADVEGLYGYEFNLSFNPDILTCVKIDIHDVLGETHYTPDFVTNNYKGFVWVNVTYYPPAEPITTYPPATLVTIKFRAKAMGTTPLDLHDASLVDSLGLPIPHEEFDGYVCIAIRDVAVTNVVPSKTQVCKGCKVYINVTVRNEGNLTESFNVSTYYDSVLIGKLLVNLDPGKNTTITFNWDTHDVTPCYNYTIKAQASVVPYETDTADNTYIDGEVKIKLTGDVNGDGKVNIKDVGIVAIAFGSKPGDPNWNPDADVYEDGKINIKDIGIISIPSNFGKSC